jgi:hypothetical protein
MNTFKRLGVSVLLFLTLGCAPMMTPYGPVPGWNVNGITGAGTGAMVGALAGAAFGNPGGGAALGAAIGGATSSYSYGGYGYYPQQPVYVQPYQYPAPYQPNYYNPYQYQPRQRVCDTVDAGGWYTQYGQYMPNYQVVCR